MGADWEDWQFSILCACFSRRFRVQPCWHTSWLLCGKWLEWVAYSSQARVSFLFLPALRTGPASDRACEWSYCLLNDEWCWWINRLAKNNRSPQAAQSIRRIGEVTYQASRTVDLLWLTGWRLDDPIRTISDDLFWWRYWWVTWGLLTGHRRLVPLACTADRPSKWQSL